MDYPKITGPFLRDTKGKVLYGNWAKPEFEYLADTEWEWTEKIDGMNTRIDWDGEHITFGGRTSEAQVPSGLLERLRGMVGDKEEIFRSVFRGATEVTLFCLGRVTVQGSMGEENT